MLKLAPRNNRPHPWRQLLPRPQPWSNILNTNKIPIAFLKLNWLEYFPMLNCVDQCKLFKRPANQTMSMWWNKRVAFFAWTKTMTK